MSGDQAGRSWTLPQRLRWLRAWVTRQPCAHCKHSLALHDEYPSPLGPGRCALCDYVRPVSADARPTS